MSEDSQDLVKFAKELKWEEWVGDAVILDHLKKIKEHVNQAQRTKKGLAESSVTSISGTNEDTTNAKRVKVVVVGDGAVGKTSLLISYATGEFPKDYVPTVFENYTAKMKRDDEPILLHLWDTAGQEEYDRLRPLSYPGADILLLCFSTISRQSFNNIKEKWAPEVKHYVPTVPTFLIGTKVDLREERAPDPNTLKVDPITTDEGKGFSKEIGAALYLEISSKTGKGVQEVFKEAVNRVLNERVGSKSRSPTSADMGHSASTRSSKSKKSSGCLLM